MEKKSDKKAIAQLSICKQLRWSRGKKTKFISTAARNFR